MSSCVDLQNEEKRYQIAKDLADNLTVSYNTSEVVMARLMQTTTAKERVYAQAVSFFGTNETVLTALSASFTGMWGLHESTADPERDEGGRQQKPRSAGRRGRQGAEGGAGSRLRPDHPRGCGQASGRLGGQLSGAVAQLSSQRCAN